MGNASKKFCGMVGYAPTELDEYGVAMPVITERKYYGDVVDLASRWQNSEQMNDDISVAHRISILADPYAIQNFPYIKYVE